MAQTSHPSSCTVGDTLAAPPHARWNFWIIALDASVWHVGVALMSPSAILPFFLCRLGAGDMMIGLMVAVQQAGWMLPQLFAASRLAHRSRKLPFLIWSCIIGRLPFLILAAVVWWMSDAWPLAVGIIFYAIFAGFWVSDALATVPWLEIVGKGIPSGLRGRLFGAIGLFGGLASAFAGLFLVDRILEHPLLPFPKNYSVLFLAVFVFMALSTVWVALIREPPGPVEDRSRPVHKLIAQIPQLLRRQPAFTRMLVAQFFLNAWTMAYPFLALAATESLGEAVAVSGAFVFAERLGATGASMIWGYLNDKLGSRFVIRGTAVTICGALALALAIPSLLALVWMWGITLPWPPIAVFAASMFLLGSAQSGMWAGLTNYMMEVVPDAERTTYIGLKNTLGGVAVIWPAVGGWVASAWSYETVFAASLGGMLVGAVVTVWLPDSSNK
ncbi:MAG: hypothetical protein QGH20_01555 [Candidatus Latescibacteria bacterium]|nr:hypothetical protein [Candidatus Latescibacterota bacterium]